MKNMILASASPRRKELLAQIGLEFQIMTSQKEEQITKVEPSQIVRELAESKALEIWETLSKEKKEQSLIIGADTIVTKEGQIMGKPTDYEDAKRMLTLLQNNTHQVFTGVALISEVQSKIRVTTFFECTNVTLYPMNEGEIDAYIQTKDPFDKAGAYGIQGSFAAFVKGIEGEYNNVVGLPIGRLFQELKKEGIC